MYVSLLDKANTRTYYYVYRDCYRAHGIDSHLAFWFVTPLFVLAYERHLFYRRPARTIGPLPYLFSFKSQVL